MFQQHTELNLEAFHYHVTFVLDMYASVARTNPLSHVFMMDSSLISGSHGIVVT